MTDELPTAGDSVGSGVTFKERTVEELLRLHFSSPQTRLSADALRLAALVLRLYVREAALRAADQAQLTAAPSVGLEHLERVLPQWLMDL